MLNLLAAGMLAATMVVTPVITDDAASPPPSERITIDLVTINGSGCPAGTTAVAASPSNTSFTVTYSDYLAAVGVGAAPVDFRKNCQLSVQIHVPQGFTYAVAQADYRGFAHLETGATGLQRASYYFMGDSTTVPLSHNFKGPYSDNFQTTDITEVAELVYAPCGEIRNLNINTELRVSAGSSDPAKTTSFMAMDSTDANVSTVYHLTWKRC